MRVCVSRTSRSRPPATLVLCGHMADHPAQQCARVGSGQAMDAQQQAYIKVACGMLPRAGPTVVPPLRACLTTYADWRILRNGDRIEGATHALGMRSLDGTAELTCYGGQSPPVSPRRRRASDSDRWMPSAGSGGCPSSTAPPEPGRHHRKYLLAAPSPQGRDRGVPSSRRAHQRGGMWGGSSPCRPSHTALGSGLHRADNTPQHPIAPLSNDQAAQDGLRIPREALPPENKERRSVPGSRRARPRNRTRRRTERSGCTALDPGHSVRGRAFVGAEETAGQRHTRMSLHSPPPVQTTLTSAHPLRCPWSVVVAFLPS